jgi:hypothetical protein
MDRKAFLIEYLGAHGAKELLFSEENDEYISGTVIYDPNDPEERQDFRWHQPKNSPLSIEVYQLVTLISKHSLLDIDKLLESPEELLAMYNSEFSPKLSAEAFNQIYDALFEIEVKMLDDGEETDSFFMHT